MSKPANLCQHDLPNGKLCRQPALKEECVCRHHMRNYRHGMYELTHEEAMDRLSVRLNQMALPELLLTLEKKLNRIRSVVSACDEARVTLRIAIQQLREKNEAHRAIQQLSQEVGMPVPGSPEFADMMERLAKSMS